MMEDYKSNSNKSKNAQRVQITPERRVEKPITTGTVTTKKKSGVQKFADVFLPEDKASIKSYIWLDVIIPGIKNALSNTLDAILYGGGRTPGKRGTASKVSYRSYYDDRPRTEFRREEYRPKSIFDYDEYVIESRGEAEAVLSLLDELIDHYGMARVLDLYDLLNLNPPSTAHKYGWTNLGNAHVVPVRGGGYTLDLPRALPID